MSRTGIFGWLDPAGGHTASLSDWCRRQGGSLAIAGGPFHCWSWPGRDLRTIEDGTIAGMLMGSVYGRAEYDGPAAVAAAYRHGRLAGLDGRLCTVLYDTDHERLVLYRDGSAGMFWLYRMLPDGAMVFSTDLDRLVTSPGTSPIIGRRGLHEYLRLLDVSTPNTIYEGVHSPEPGQELWLELGADSPRPRPEAAPAVVGETAESVSGTPEEQVERLLIAAVAKRLPPHGPILAFLSGGIDSALIAAIAAELAPGRVSAYTVGFEELGFDETPIAAAIAGHLGLPHRALRLPLSAYRPAFDELYSEVSFPFADPTAVPTLLAYREARTIAPFALDGTGAEVCVGTMPPRHERVAVQYGALLPRWLRDIGSRTIGALGPLAGYRPLIDFADPEEVSMRWRGWTRREVERLCGEPVSLAHTRFYRTFARYGRGEHFERYTSLLAAMPDDRIHEINRLLGFELRFPFFDPELAAAIAALPLELRDPPGESKRILRTLLARRVPREIWDLPKHGFDFPFADFMAIDDYALLRDYLPQGRVRAYGLVDPDIVADTVARFRAGDQGLAFRVWALVVLFAWLERHWRPLAAGTGDSQA